MAYSNIDTIIDLHDSITFDSINEITSMGRKVEAFVPIKVGTMFTVPTMNISINFSISFKKDSDVQLKIQPNRPYICRLIAVNVLKNSVLEIMSFDLTVEEDEISQGRVYNTTKNFEIHNFNAPNLGEYELMMFIEDEYDRVIYEGGYRTFTLGAYRRQ